MGRLNCFNSEFSFNCNIVNLSSAWTGIKFDQVSCVFHSILVCSLFATIRMSCLSSEKITLHFYINVFCFWQQSFCFFGPIHKITMMANFSLSFYWCLSTGYLLDSNLVPIMSWQNEYRKFLVFLCYIYLSIKYWITSIQPFGIMLLLVTPFLGLPVHMIRNCKVPP